LVPALEQLESAFVRAQEDEAIPGRAFPACWPPMQVGRLRSPAAATWAAIGRESI
jgi:hypothetical protein